MTTRIATSLLCLTLATPVAAQTVVDGAVSDLNGDGLRERFTLLHDGSDNADLIIEDTGTGRITVPDIVRFGSIANEPSVDLANNGSVRLKSKNMSAGPDRWHLTLTIAFRLGAYQIAGYTFDWHDKTDPDIGGGCDLNLLNGKGFVWNGDGPKRPIRHDVEAVPVTAWNVDIPTPAICLSQAVS